MLTRADLLSDLADQRRHADPRVRAVGDNLAFEENVAPARVREFEDWTVGQRLRAALASYFHDLVEGVSRSHVPTTFGPANAPALMSPSIEPNQEIVRLVRLDDALDRTSKSFLDLEAALNGSSRDDTVIAPVVRELNRHPNARPAFAAFAIELTDDLNAPDWAFRLVTRLGLGHYLPPEGVRWHYGLMTYTAADVFSAAGTITQPFAVPTILECSGHVWFFPPPRCSGAGYVVDLDPRLTRDLTREFLHMRIEFQARHLKRVGSIVGVDAQPELRALRNGHLDRVRSVACRPDYAEMMS